MTINTLRIEQPDTPLTEATWIWAEERDHHLKMISDLGELTYITGITGVVRVDKVVADAALEGPGNGLPSDAPDQRYLLLTNGSDGSRDSSWGAIEDAEGTMLIERAKDNFSWLTQHVNSDGVGKFIVYDENTEDLWIQTGSGWRKYSGGALKIGPVLSADNTLTPGILTRISGTDNYTLPPALANKGQIITIKFMDNSVSGPTLYPTGIDTIEFQASFLINQAYQAVKFISDGTTWLKI